MWLSDQEEIGPARKAATMLFVFSLLGIFSPIVLPLGAFWLKRRHKTLRRIGGVHEVLAWFGIGLSVMWLFILMLVILL